MKQIHHHRRHRVRVLINNARVKKRKRNFIKIKLLRMRKNLKVHICWFSKLLSLSSFFVQQFCDWLFAMLWTLSNIHKINAKKWGNEEGMNTIKKLKNHKKEIKEKQNWIFLRQVKKNEGTSSFIDNVSCSCTIF